MRRLLIVDDEPTIRNALAANLSGRDLTIETASDAQSALARIHADAPDLVLSDIRMPGLDGLELMAILKERCSGVDVVLMTAFDDMETVVRAMREGAADFLSKPLDLHEVRTVLERVFEDRRARERAERGAEEAAAPYRLHTLVGRDPKMIEIYKMVGRLADNRVTVLIRGETGTGKELVARAVHFNSPEAAEPFVAVNCTALTETLLESELFGHVRGAFTGAVADRRGRFALAGRGTIFLDEIGDTSLEFQAKLLRVLEERQFFPVGAEVAAATEARVVAATHRDLDAMIERGEFRDDLFYRLRVVEIPVPPLRERPSDIPLLAAHFVRKAAEALHRPGLTLPDESREILLDHDWPGNVRELEHRITRAAVLAAGDVLRPEHLFSDDSPAALPGGMRSLEEVERDHVARVLIATNGDKTRAADILGISRPRLYRMIERHALG